MPGWNVADVRLGSNRYRIDLGGSRRRSLLVVLMTIQGLGYLLPTNLWVCIQLRLRARSLISRCNGAQSQFRAILPATRSMRSMR